ncbi:hypothetical protein H0E87_019213 [Populus deltoides]|uniref:Uncharacterized protein n=1 Tax=Populus deltoides TaxID=3696 RepID=A0A8T2XUE0_POPDE|nr:hypothetical protein H0E87_019213 [Populus deltoides]
MAGSGLIIWSDTWTSITGKSIVVLKSPETSHSPPPFQACILEEMASENADVGDLNASTSSKQAILPEKMPSTKSASNSNLEKALAQRALFGSRNHSTKGRKIKNNGVLDCCQVG